MKKLSFLLIAIVMFGLCCCCTANAGNDPVNPNANQDPTAGMAAKFGPVTTVYVRVVKQGVGVPSSVQVSMPKGGLNEDTDNNGQVKLYLPAGSFPIIAYYPKGNPQMNASKTVVISKADVANKVTKTVIISLGGSAAPAAPSQSRTAVSKKPAADPLATVYIRVLKSGVGVASRVYYTTSGVPMDVTTDNNGQLKIYLPAGTYDLKAVYPAENPQMSAVKKVVVSRNDAVNKVTKSVVITVR